MSTATQAPATVAVIGTGAVGCYYGARLAEGGHDVRFLVRQGIDAVRENGIHVTSHRRHRQRRLGNARLRAL